MNTDQPSTDGTINHGRKILIGDPSPDEPPPEPLVISALQLIIIAERPTIMPAPLSLSGIVTVKLKIEGNITVPAIPHVTGFKWKAYREQADLPGIRGKLFPWADPGCDCVSWKCNTNPLPASFNQAINVTVNIPENTVDNLVAHLRTIGHDWDRMIREAQVWAASFKEWSVRIP